MTKYILTICSLLFYSQIAYTQSAEQDEAVLDFPLTAQSMESFRAICANISQYPIIRGKFEQEKIIQRLNRSIKSSGDFTISSKQGMIWDTINPFPSTLVLGSDFMIQIRAGGQRTVLSAQGNETFQSMAQVISGIFSGNALALENNFRIFFNGNTSSWVMALIPLDKTISAFAQRIIIKGDNIIKSIRIYEQSGDSIIYNLLNHSFPSVLNDIERAYLTYP